jgi:hypothetical protein
MSGLVVVRAAIPLDAILDGLSLRVLHQQN